MKRKVKPTGTQFTLPLLTESAAVLPGDKQRELALALVELLIGAARESVAESARRASQAQDFRFNKSPDRIKSWVSTDLACDSFLLTRQKAKAKRAKAVAKCQCHKQK